MEPVIIEAAISASGSGRSPAAPTTLDALTQDICACIDAGAAIVHNHLEDFSLSGSDAARRYGMVWRPVLERHPGAILIPTLAAPVAGNDLGGYAHLAETVAQGASLAPLDPGSVNMTGALPDGQPDPRNSAVFANDYATLDRALDHFAAHAIPASISIWDPSFLRAAMAYERAGRLVAGSFIKLFFGGTHSYLDGRPGISFGLPPTVAALDVYLQMMAGSRLPWAAALLGDDILAERDFLSAVVSRGGHLRVGLEDYAGRGTPTNVELVARAAEIVSSLGRPPASMAQARDILRLGPPRVRQERQ